MSDMDFYKFLGLTTIFGVAFIMSLYRVLWPVPAAAINANTQARIDQNEGHSVTKNSIKPLTTMP